MTRCLSVLVALAMVASACQPEDDIASGKAFQPAFPDKDVLTIQVQGLEEDNAPLSSVSQALVGDRAYLHDLSFLVAWRVNVPAYYIVAAIWFITRFPPTVAVEEDGELGEDAFPYNARATWGPFPDNEKNLEFVLNVWRGEDPADGRTTFVFLVSGRPQGTGDEDWVVFLKGGAKPFEAGFDERIGAVKLDMDAMAELDPTEDDVGVVNYVYVQQRQPAAHAVVAVGEGVKIEGSDTEVTDFTYFFGRSSEGYAVLEFDTNADLSGVVELPEDNALERLQVTTGWLYNGDGRSDARISGADLGDASAAMTQCWGLDKKQTYFLFSTKGFLPKDIEIVSGLVDDCFTPEPLELPEVDYKAIAELFD